MDEAKGQNRDRWTYDVFLSFRGSDVRGNFLGYLYKSLVTSGVYTFKDDVELEGGDSIPVSLSNAIANSKIHVVILSKEYATSPWCLEELAEIMECLGSNSGHVVIPIFKDVDPSDVRRQKGSYRKAFDKHEIRYPMSTLQKWKDALVKVANISGFPTNQYRGGEVNLIENVSREILKMLPSSYLSLPTYVVGITSRVHRIHELMCFGSDDVKIIGICGMGGIGKTTLAKASYNEFSDRFEGTSFLENFGEYFKQTEGKDRLQQRLLSEILRRDDMVFNNKDHAMKQRFRNKRVLVVIDNVEDMTQLNKVSIDINCFGPGSRIIVSSRDKHVLEQLGIKNICSPKELDHDESLELVSRHAFRAMKPPEAFLELSNKLVDYCGGLPLAMEVLGASLYNRTTSQWEDTLELLKRNPDADIQAKLRISFDGLKPVQKEIFLDIACFFTEMEKDYVDCVLDACQFGPDLGLSVLMEKCLITVRDNKLVMHDLLRDMGRDIVQEMSPNNRGKRSRLWDPDDVLDVLTKRSGTDAIEGLSLKAEITDPRDFEAEALSNMQELRLLQLSHVQVEGSYAHFPKGLKWLCWLGYPLASVPTNMHMGSLVVMDLQYSNLKRLWGVQEPQPMKNLKYLDLSHSFQLTETPDFSYLPNLEKLLFINCERLVVVHKSIGTLHKKLILLNLNGCTKLSDLPIEIYNLKSLETLILSGCSQLERLDDALGEMESLTTLRADSTGLSHIPSSSNQLKKLQELSLHGCIGLWKDRDYHHYDKSLRLSLSPPLSLNGLSCLKTLRLGFCNLSDELVPETIGSLSCLEELDLRGNIFQNLKIDFAGLLDLQIIRLDSCSELQSMLSLPKNLMSFFASNCIKLERTPDLSECLKLQSLHLTNCFNLVETPGLDKLKTVGVIHMEMCNRVSDTYRERIMQRFAVGANGGIFIPGSSLPNWIRFKNDSQSVSFNVPESLNPDPVGFTLWTLYMSKQDDDVMSQFSPKVTVKNQTKGTVWSRKPATDHIRMYVKKHIWQGHFSNEELCFKTGDEVEVSVDFGDEVTILETGLSLAYREEITFPIRSRI